MPRFFVENPVGEKYILDGENAKHAILSLRVKVGEEITLCTGDRIEYTCVVTEVNKDNLCLKINDKASSVSEIDTRLHLYQCLVKSDKMDYIIQKAVELGVCDITPVISAHCIGKINDKETKKLDRWNKIALEAAKQSGRGIIPKVLPPLKFDIAIKEAKGDKILFYEKSNNSLKEFLSQSISEDITVLIGPEGGFANFEVERAVQCGFNELSLGSRILRAETASLSALSIISYEKDK